MAARGPLPAVAKPDKLLKGPDRLWASGGIVEKLMRKYYQECTAMDKNRSWTDKAARKEWVAYRKDMTDREVAMCEAENWEYVNHIYLSRTSANYEIDPINLSLSLSCLTQKTRTSRTSLVRMTRSVR